jgi:hypothetical protein
MHLKRFIKSKSLEILRDFNLNQLVIVRKAFSFNFKLNQSFVVRDDVCHLTKHLIRVSMRCPVVEDLDSLIFAEYLGKFL